MNNARITCCGVSNIIPQVVRMGAVVMVEMDMTTLQRLNAVEELLGAIPEQQAYEGMKARFPEWFEVTA